MGKDTELFKAAQSGNNTVLEKAFANHLKRLSGGPSHHGSGLGSTRSKLHPNIQDSDGSTLLHHAILNGHRETVSLLLKCGASTSTVDHSGSAPLHLASWKGDLEVVKMLVTQGPSYANVNQQNDSEDTGLHLASRYGYSSVIEFLLQRHADPLLRNSREETPLDLAAQYGHLSCVHFLISFSPETLRPAPRGLSPLHLAARNGHTIVALSLINAGIPINTIGERGSALHEAALCGKMDMVELLLDKGVDCDLRDSEDHTVFEALQLYTANQATEICRRIQLHLDDERRTRSRSLRNPVSRVLAVAKTTSQPLVEGSSALAFHTGDQITVLRSVGGGVYYGTVREKSGSFLAEDVFFYKEVDGDLVATEEADLNMLPDSSSNRHSYSNEDMSKSFSKSPPLAPILERSNGNMEASKSTSSCQPRPHIGSVGGACVSRDRSASPSHEEVSDLSVCADDTSLVGGQSRGSLVAGSSAGSSASSPRTSDREPSNRLSDPKSGEEGGVARKMTKREKKFALARDRGQYSELNPISPHEAKKEFGESLHLKPVEAPAVGTEEHSSTADAVTFSSAVPQPNAGGEDFRGSYYVLEVGNFGTTSPTSESTSRTGSRLSEQFSDSSSRTGIETQPLAGESGYFMLNTEDPAASGEDDVYSSVSANRKVRYENIKRLPVAPPTSVDEGGSEQQMARLHPHLVMVENPGEEGTPPGVHTRCPDAQRHSMYENISLASTTPSTTPSTASSRTHSDVSNSRLSAESGNRHSLYENVATFSVSSPHDSSSTPNPTPSGNTTGSEREKVKRSAQQRRDAYEIMPLKSQRSKAGKCSSHDNTSSSTGDTLPDGETAPASSSSFRVDVCTSQVRGAADGQVGGASGRASDQEGGASNPAGEGQNGAAEQTVNGVAGLESSIIQITRDNPFAGLVITSQSCAQDQTVGSVGGTGEEGNPELWDSVKVEQEWSQIDCLMQDVTGTFGSPPLSPDERHSVSPPTEISAWLSMVGMSGCSAVLLVNGFDSLRFLGGGILVMDDLQDIGIMSMDDQYNLMAAVSLLAPPPPVGHASTVEEWLVLLDLEILQSKFENYTLNRISTLWDVQLTSVIGVELLGYRKRLQYGIEELCRTHPEWPKNYDLQANNKQNHSQLPSPPRRLSPVKKLFLKDYRALRSSAATSSLSSNTDVISAHLKMRAPVDAQSLGGTGGRVPRLPSQMWHHDNEALIRDSINYKVKYLGSVIVKKLHGSQSAEEACLKLRMSTQHMKKVPEITLAVSWKGVKFLDSQSKHMVSFHAIRDVSFCTSDIEDQNVFAYITKDRDSGKNYSHVFVANSQEVADDIRMTLAQAFEICYQKVMRVRMMSPEIN